MYYFLQKEKVHKHLNPHYIDSWNVREITSSCCSFVNLTKLTAYPETRIVNCGYFSGCF